MTHLEFARRQKGWTQQTLGELPSVRIGREFISLLENDKALPTPDQAERLARALGVSAERLMTAVVMPEVSEVSNG